MGIVPVKLLGLKTLHKGTGRATHQTTTTCIHQGMAGPRIPLSHHEQQAPQAGELLPLPMDARMASKPRLGHMLVPLPCTTCTLP